MTCRDIEPLLSQHLDGACSRQEEALLAEHLGGCPSCTQLRQELARTKGLLRGLPAIPAPPGLARAVGARLRSATARREPLWHRLSGWLRPPAAWRTATAVGLAAVALVAFLGFAGWLTPNGADHPNGALTAAHADTLSDYVDAATALHRAYVNQVQPFETTAYDSAPAGTPSR